MSCFFFFCLLLFSVFPISQFLWCECHSPSSSITAHFCLFSFSLSLSNNWAKDICFPFVSSPASDYWPVTGHCIQLLTIMIIFFPLKTFTILSLFLLNFIFFSNYFFNFANKKKENYFSYHIFFSHLYYIKIARNYYVLLFINIYILNTIKTKIWFSFRW